MPPKKRVFVNSKNQQWGVQHEEAGIRKSLALVLRFDVPTTYISYMFWYLWKADLGTSCTGKFWHIQENQLGHLTDVKLWKNLAKCSSQNQHLLGLLANPFQTTMK